MIWIRRWHNCNRLKPTGGGATTDVHSVTEGSEKTSRILISPEPVAKRTVEGELGVYVNLPHIVKKIGMENLLNEFDVQYGGLLSDAASEYVSMVIK